MNVRIVIFVCTHKIGYCVEYGIENFRKMNILTILVRIG